VETLAALLLNMGCYNVFSNNLHFSDAMNDFLRGTLSDSAVERWGISQISQWLGGKRFNIIHPSPPREASRAYEFEGKEYHNRKALAHAFHSNWEQARGLIRQGKLDRWLEQAVKAPQLSDTLHQVITMTGGPYAKGQKQNDELLARVISILDPEGPIRCRNLAVHIDAIGRIVCYGLVNSKTSQLNTLLEIIEADLPHFWSELQKDQGNPENPDVMFKLQRMRAFIRNNNPGFGIERLLYELNASLPCLSDQLQQYSVTTPKELLLALDMLAKKQPDKLSLLDRHAAAFLCSRLMINKDFTFREISAYAPQLAQSAELKIIRILARAQEKENIKELKGLSYFVGITLIEKLDLLHSNNIKDALAHSIKRSAETGNIGEMLHGLLNIELLEKDMHGFAQAKQLYQRNQQEIKALKDQGVTKKHARKNGIKLASRVAATVFVVTLLIVTNAQWF
jgi:hypothetical protein